MLIKVPPQQILFHYAEWVHAQLEDMAKEEIIFPSTSPWCGPAIHVSKSSGEVQGFCKTQPDDHWLGRKCSSSWTCKLPTGNSQWMSNQLRRQPFVSDQGIHCHAIWADWGHTDMSESLGSHSKNMQGLCWQLCWWPHSIFRWYSMKSHISDLRWVLQKLKAAAFA